LQFETKKLEIIVVVYNCNVSYAEFIGRIVVQVSLGKKTKQNKTETLPEK
jgi:hypothetical protein